MKKKKHNEEQGYYKHNMALDIKPQPLEPH